MAIEEAGALGCLLPAGTSVEDVPGRLEAYQDIRKERGDFVNHESVEQLKRLRRGGAAVQGTWMEVDLESELYSYFVRSSGQTCPLRCVGSRTRVLRSTLRP
jgi:hypothetical protein